MLRYNKSKCANSMQLKLMPLHACKNRERNFVAVCRQDSLQWQFEVEKKEKFFLKGVSDFLSTLCSLKGVVFLIMLRNYVIKERFLFIKLVCTVIKSSNLIKV